MLIDCFDTYIKKLRHHLLCQPKGFAFIADFYAIRMGLFFKYEKFSSTVADG